MVSYNTYITQQDVKPLVNTQPFTAPRLRFSIHVGSYVILNGYNLSNNKLKNRSGNAVIRVMSYDINSNTIHGRLFIPLYAVLETVDTIDNVGNNVQPIQTGILAGIEELVSTPKCIIASTTDIVDVCFVFHMDDVINGVVNGQGITNCYLYRYYYDLEGEVTQQLTCIEYSPCFASEMEEYTGEHSPSCTFSIF
jgi:hypothetical protein